MRTKLTKFFPLVVLLAASPLFSQQTDPQAGKPEDTEFYEPVPKIVTPGATNSAPPSDAIVLFDGKNSRPMGFGAGQVSC